MFCIHLGKALLIFNHKKSSAHFPLQGAVDFDIINNVFYLQFSHPDEASQQHGCLRLDTVF